jgi:hypothetical protein
VEVHLKGEKGQGAATHLEIPRATPAHGAPGRGKMIRPKHNQNTTISALITLRHTAVGRRRLRKIWDEFPNLNVNEAIQAAIERFPNFDVGEKRLGVIVWENAVARIRLSRDLFTGPYDLRWGAEGDNQRIVFCGKKLSELEDV